MELQLKYRPERLQDVVGQEATVKALDNYLNAGKVPHAIMFFGGTSGVGKTTLARILAMELINTNDLSKVDYLEVNAASDRGIGTIRDIEDMCRMNPLYSSVRVVVIDESHRLTKDAFSSILKVLEETPVHTYIFLCTTELESHPQTVKTRCTKLECKPISDDQLSGLLRDIAKKEKFKLDKKVEDKIIECAKGSAREALNILGKVAVLPTVEEQLDSILPEKIEKTAKDLVNLLINKKPKWVEVAELLKDLGDYDPEKVRLSILGYAAVVALNSPKKVNRAYLVLLAFENNFWQSKKAGLIRACLEVAKDDTAD